MYILGVSCFYHDAASALIKDGNLICAAEEERFSRRKHDFGFPQQSIKFCLEFAQIKPKDLEYVVFYEKPFLKFERILKTIIDTFPHSCSVFQQAMKNWLTEKLWIKNLLRENIPVKPEKILFVEHHLAHAASAYLYSPFKQAAILTLDGAGEWATNTLGIGNDNEISLIKQLNFPISIGLLYSTFTAFLGFEVNEGEYKLMGMAPYGIPKFTDKIFEHILDLHDDGSFSLNMDYFAYTYSARRSYSKKFEKLFGPPRSADDDFFTEGFDYPAYFDKKPHNYKMLCQKNQYYADIAASIQKITEEIILKQANYLYDLTKLKKLCIAGGVGLNAVANGRLLKEGPFDELFIQPAAGDSGGAIGAAAYIYHSVLNNKRTFSLEHSYWGKEYAQDCIRNFLESKKVSFNYYNQGHELINLVVDALIEGEVIGWFQGRFEWGPRALGNRSILADPRKVQMKDTVNLKIKFREPFRPFAPVILEEKLEDFFIINKAAQQYPLRFMLLVLPIKQAMRKLIPAVDHNGTARVQVIRKKWNPLYYELIEAFAKKTDVPILLNTSFNIKGEPIVNSPEQAYNTFINSGLDMLVMGNFVIRKGKNEKNTRSF